MQLRIAKCMAVVALAVGGRIASAEVFADPVGDAQIGGSGQGSLPVDLVGITAEAVNGNIRLQLEFSKQQPIAPPSSGLPNALGGAIDFDVDQNRATGIPGFVDAFRNVLGAQPSRLGVDASIIFSSEEGGLVELLEGGVVRDTVPISFSQNFVEILFPQTLLENPPAGSFIDFAVLVGTDDGPTDTAPNTFGTFAVPEPSAITAAGAACALITSLQRNRTRRCSVCSRRD